MPLLLDTNVLSDIRRLKPEPKVLAFIAACPLYELYISAVTLAELRFGIERLNAGQRRDELTRWLIHTVRPMFDERILSVTEDILFRWRVLLEEGAKSDIPIRNRTSFIAATALHHGFTVVTRDRDDFDKAGAAVINPWQEPPQRISDPRLMT